MLMPCLESYYSATPELIELHLRIPSRNVPLGGSPTTVALDYAGSERRLELVATDTILIFDAASAHQ